MDAQSTNVTPERKARFNDSDAELNNLRSSVLEAENRIVEDVDKIKEMFTPEKLASFFTSAVREELLVRMKSIDSLRLRRISGKIKTVIQEYPITFVLLGLGLAGGAVAYGVLNSRQTGQLETGEEEIGDPEIRNFQDQDLGPIVPACEQMDSSGLSAQGEIVSSGLNAQKEETAGLRENTD
jgi:hypothetical protein